MAIMTRRRIPPRAPSMEPPITAAVENAAESLVSDFVGPRECGSWPVIAGCEGAVVEILVDKNEDGLLLAAVTVTVDRAVGKLLVVGSISDQPGTSVTTVVCREPSSPMKK